MRIEPSICGAGTSVHKLRRAKHEQNHRSENRNDTGGKIDCRHLGLVGELLQQICVRRLERK